MSVVDILIVEDEDALRESLVRGLAASFPDHRTEGAASVEDALPLIGLHSPRVVVSDVRLPGKDGVQLLIHVREEAPETTFVLMSAYRSPQAEQHARADGIRLLTKPFEFQELVDAVEEGLGTDVSFHGQVGGISLIDLLQILNMGRRTVAVTIERRGIVGRIFLSAGEIVHAEVEELRGREAFETLIAWRGGKFGTDPLASPTEITMEDSFNSLLLDSVRLQDESSRLPGDPEDAESWLDEGIESLEVEKETDDAPKPFDLSLGITLLPACVGVGRVDLERGDVDTLLADGSRASDEEVRELESVVAHAFELAPLKAWDAALSGGSSVIQEVITLSEDWIHVLRRPQLSRPDVFVIVCPASAGVRAVVPIARRWLRLSKGK